jgi:hypothetical protein
LATPVLALRVAPSNSPTAPMASLLAASDMA